MADEQEQSFLSKWVSKTVFSTLVLIVTCNFWPEVIPFDIWSFWDTKGSIGEWLSSSWILFVWGFGITLLGKLLHRTPTFLLSRSDPWDVFVSGFWVSVRAGLFEEVTIRWVIFLAAIPLALFGNFIFFDFMGFGVAEWIHLNIAGPVANFTTMEYLQPWLFHETSWSIGAALLVANAFFRSGHAYQGIFGLINSWVLGMYFFWVMFTHGLVPAILIHFLYDFIIFTLVAVHLAYRQSRPEAALY